MPFEEKIRESLWKNGVVLSFDLDTERLKKYFSKTAPQGAYDVIKRFLKNNGFEHRKDSDYVNSRLNKVDASKLMYSFARKNKWFPLCAKKMIISPNVITLDIIQGIRELTDTEWQAEKDAENASAALL